MPSIFLDDRLGSSPYIPPIDPSNASDTQNFDDTFLDMGPEREREQTDLEPTDGEDSVATPSQSRSSSAHPPEDLMDVFDGYSFKGRHSVIIDDEEEVSEEEEEEEEEENVTGPSILDELNGKAAAATVVLGKPEEPISEPKTPEARPTTLPPSTPPAKRSPVTTRPELPPVDTSAKPGSFADATPRASEDAPGPAPSVPISPVKAVAHAAAAAASTSPDIHHKEPKKASAPKTRRQRDRREKSGVPALDRDLSDANEEDDVRTERDEEDDEWDFIEADGEDRNGARGTNLFACGDVDRYRLAVFRKGSTPNRSTTTNDTVRLSAATSGSSSPSPTAKERRGRTGAGLPFRRKTFLCAKSPPSSSTRSSQSRGKSFTTMSERSRHKTVAGIVDISRDSFPGDDLDSSPADPTASRQPGSTQLAESQGSQPSLIRVEMTVLRAINVPHIKTVFGGKRECYVTIAYQARTNKAKKTKKTKSVRIEGKRRCETRRLMPYLVLCLYAKRLTQRDLLVGGHEITIPAESESDISVVLGHYDGQAGRSTQPVTLNLTIVVPVNRTSTSVPKNIPTERDDTPAEEVPTPTMAPDSLVPDQSTEPEHPLPQPDFLPVQSRTPMSQDQADIEKAPDWSRSR
ncbi:hypothetical protein EI94DRAFT_1703469 [Lactarius quietus]|nr:hypothetical protein EI94DRAFT_1703469 [Lactarius quietus]